MRLAEASLIMALGHFIIMVSSSTEWIFLSGVVLTGIGFEPTSSSCVCTSELFGLKNHSKTTVSSMAGGVPYLHFCLTSACAVLL